MPKKLVIVPVNMGSKGAKALANKLSGLVGHKVWMVKPDRVRGRVPFQLREGTDKLTQFRKFEENNVTHPDYTSDAAEARAWAADGTAVVCRTLLRSSEGRGIVMADNAEAVVPAALYTKYVKKKKEFRVHVFNGKVIDVQEKRKRKDGPADADSRVRNLSHGYVFCREGIVEPVGLRELATKATSAIGYKLGAVDIAFNERSSTCYVLEVNATPGMEGTTLDSYSKAIVEWYKEQK